MLVNENNEIIEFGEDYDILQMQVYCLIENDKHKIITIVDYIKNNKRCRKVFENILEERAD